MWNLLFARLWIASAMPRNDEVVSVSVYKIVDCFVIANEAKRSAAIHNFNTKGDFAMESRI
ncbi:MULTISPECIES: hypothetical protein [Helicobacter]|uniref:hypothetical protein n=1 Tax=Helicobacter TaxID=209 RepID=UPI000DCDEAD0|nr:MULTISPECIES: hypothetical protein [Helicobacter]MCI2235315.1 hypothetical protein [Helicobacter sp. CaF467b]MCI7047253.1 hypothetical protein [Helicobacter sp.]MCI7764959.1 hypothetical protein [Helicobacter sp.]MCL9823561.1 hypothetical protein [Helicobacter colisuis]MDY4426406.1 hypothetical protein [Helicobacter sp.]